MLLFKALETSRKIDRPCGLMGSQKRLVNSSSTNDKARKVYIEAHMNSDHRVLLKAVIRLLREPQPLFT